MSKMAHLLESQLDWVVYKNDYKNFESYLTCFKFLLPRQAAGVESVFEDTKETCKVQYFIRG